MAQPSPHGQFAGDIRFTLVAKVLYLLTRVALPPIVLAHVPLADYGLWSIAFIVVSYLGLTASGFASVYVRRGAIAHAAGDVAQISRLLSTGITVLGSLSLTLFAGLLLALPWTLNALDVAPAQRATASLLVLGACGIFLADIALGAYAYLLQGIGRIRSEQKIWVAAFLIEVVVAIALLQAQWGIAALLAAFALRYCFSIGAAMVCLHRTLPGLRLSPRLFDRVLLREFLGFGSLIQLSALFANALHSAERVLAAGLLGPAAAALFDLGNKLPSTATSIPSAVSTVTLPAAARSRGQREVAELYLRSTRISALLTAMPMPFLAFFALPLCQFWLGQHDSIELIAGIMSLLTLACHLHILTGPGSSIFRGIGQAGNEFVYHGLRLLLLAFCVTPLALSDQLAARPLAMAIGLAGLLAALAYLAWNHRQLTGQVRSLGAQVILPAVAGYPAAALTAAMFAFSGLWPAGSAGRPALILPLLLAFVVYALFFARIYLRFVLNADEQARLRNLWRRLSHRPTPTLS